MQKKSFQTKTNSAQKKNLKIQIMRNANQCVMALANVYIERGVY